VRRSNVRHTRRAAIVVAGVLIAFLPIGAQAAPTPAPVAQLAQDWARHWRSKDLEDVLALYAPDAVWVSGDGRRVTGATELHEFFASVLKGYSAKIDMRSVNGGSSGDLGYDSGDYSELITPVAAAADKIAVHGAWLIVARRIDGHWRIAEQFWTQSTPVHISR
jgi:uncharacterized protein (TIGR02246 family)